MTGTGHHVTHGLDGRPNLSGRGTGPRSRRTSSGCAVCTGLECVCRPRWFAGQVLSDVDLEAEQRWVISKNRLHNLHLHGSGVVCGLQVSCHPSCEGWVRVGTGYAIDPCGDDIVVPDPVDFDVLGAIEACLKSERTAAPHCTPRKGTVDCTPDGTWCLTIRYHEWADRAVRPLRRGMEGGSSSSCGCGSSGGGSPGGGGGKGGCGCGGGSPRGSSGGGCRSCGPTTTGRCGTASADPCRPPSSGPTDPACEPTRWCEGFALQLCRQSDDDDRQSFLDVIEGTLLGAVFGCWATISQLQARATSYATLQEGAAGLDLLRAELGAALSRLELTRCDLLDQFAAVGQVRPPDKYRDVRLESLDDEDLDEDEVAAIRGYQGAIDASVNDARRVSWRMLLFCLCEHLLPPCPTPAEDDFLVLACMTVRDGQVVDICNFAGRKQVVTWPAVRWWLSIVPLEPALRALIEALCCGSLDSRVMARLVGHPDVATYATQRAHEPFDLRDLASGLGSLFPGGWS